MEVGSPMSIAKIEERRVDQEIEPSVDDDRPVGDGAHWDARAGEELTRDLVTNGRAMKMEGMEVFEVFER
eukprot:8734909-Pyramimonas_sp.AAC.1